MILNVIDANKAIEFLQEENTNYPNTFSNKMTPDEFNTNSEAIETHLNILYEKIRTLQDLDAFCRDYAVKRIKEEKDILDKKLRTLENLSDLYRSPGSVTVTIPFDASEEVIKDRDGAIVAPMTIKDNSLAMGTDTVKEALISTISRDSDVACYNDTYQNIKDGQPGTSIYYLKKEEGADHVVENIVVTFDQELPANSIYIEPIGAEVQNIRLVHSSHNETPVNSPNTFFPEQKITGIKFSLKSDSYDLVQMNGQKDMMTINDAFGTYGEIQTHWVDYQKVKDIEKSIADNEKKYNVAVYRSLYNTWDKFNEKVRNKNIVIEES